MKMTNQEIIAAINGISKITKIQEDSKKSFFTVKGQYALFYNNKTLMDKYRPYEESYIRINKQCDGNADKLKESVSELLSVSVDVGELKTITEDDFKDGITANMMMCIDFMIADS